MNVEHPVIQEVYVAKGSMREADLLIQKYLPFIKKETAKFLQRPPIEGQDDELSIAMLAFHEAVQFWFFSQWKALKDHDSSGRVFDYTGRTDLRQLMAAIAESTLYISADTGPLHIANALKKELIALFGPTCPQRTGPYGGNDDAYIHMVLSPTSQATPERPLVDDPDCMAQITPDMLWQVYEGVLKKVKL